jgi:allantoin racemase
VRILAANPNATQAMTEACLALARRAASPGTEIVGWTNRAGPPVVDSAYRDYLAGGLLAPALRDFRPPPDAVVLTGFGNYGTAAVKELLDMPVVSMAEAAMALAVPLCHRFGIVTTAARMVPYTEDLVRLLGFSAKCAAVRAVELPPFSEAAPAAERILEQLAAAARRTRDEDGADLIVLGGSRLSPYAEALRDRTAVPVVEPVAAGVQFAEALVRLGLRQSKTGKYAPPPRLPGDIPWDVRDDLSS